MSVLGAAATVATAFVLRVDQSSSVFPLWRLLVAIGVVATVPLGSLWFRRGRRRAALAALWVGAVVTILAAAIVSQSAVGQAAALLYLLLVSVALLAGALLQALVEAAMGHLRRRRAAG